jgi:MFS family permease
MSPTPQSARTKIRRIAVGRMISVTGGAAAYTALNFTIWDRTHSPAMQALTLLLTFGVAGILGPFTGALGDRFDRRKVMIWSEAVSAAFFFAMALVMARMDAPLLLIALAFGSAIAEQPFFSSSRAAIPILVESEDQISWANSLVTLGVHSGIAVGPVLGGVLLAAVGASWVFALNAVSFLVSLALTLTVRGRFQEDREAMSEAERHEHRGIAAGIRFLWTERVLRRLTLAWLVFVLGMGMGMVADAGLAESFEAGALGFALMITAWGTGSVVGAGSGRWMSVRTEPVWLVVGAFGVSAAAFAVGFAPVFPIVLVALFLMGTFDGLTMVADNGIMQRRTPDAVRSRTMAAFEAAISLGLGVAYVLAGPVIEAVGPQPTYVVGGVTALLAAITLVPLLALRRTAPDGAPATRREEEGEEAEREIEADVAPPIPSPRYTSAEALEFEESA